MIFLLYISCHVLHIICNDNRVLYIAVIQLRFPSLQTSCFPVSQPWKALPWPPQVPVLQALLEGKEGHSVSVAFPSQPFTGFGKREIMLLFLILLLFSKTIRFWCCQSGIPSLALEKLISVILCILHWKPCKMQQNSPVIFFPFSHCFYVVS